MRSSILMIVTASEVLMIKRRSFFLLTMFILAPLAGCQSVTPGLETLVPDITGNEKDIKGEVQWNFAAVSGDIVTLSLSDAQGVLIGLELRPAPGAKHVPFELATGKAQSTRCRSGGSCRYEASLKRGETVKARGQIYYTPTSTPLVVMETVGMTPGDSPQLPKPVYQ